MKDQKVASQSGRHLGWALTVSVSCPVEKGEEALGRGHGYAKGGHCRGTTSQGAV